MTQDQIVSLFAGLKSKLPVEQRRSKVLVCAFLKSKGFQSNVWVPVDGQKDARLRHVDVMGHRRGVQIVISIGGSRPGKRDQAKLEQFLNDVVKVVILHNPDYEPKTLDSGIVVIGL